MVGLRFGRGARAGMAVVKGERRMVAWLGEIGTWTKNIKPHRSIRLTHLQYLAAQSSNLPAVPPSGAVPSRRAWLETSFPPPTPYSQDLDDTNILRAQNH